MISDAPYQATGLALPPHRGIVAGLVGAAMMLFVIAVLPPPFSPTVRDVLREVGAMAPISATSSDTPILIAGGVLHESLGALFGLLYAVCQQRVPVYGMLSVGVFYGFAVWVGSSLLSHWWLHRLQPILHSTPWLLACLLYGLCLATAATVSAAHRSPADAPVVLKD